MVEDVQERKKMGGLISDKMFVEMRWRYIVGLFGIYQKITRGVPGL
jgi:hypothetical protein